MVTSPAMVTLEGGLADGWQIPRPPWMTAMITMVDFVPRMLNADDPIGARALLDHAERRWEGYTQDGDGSSVWRCSSPVADYPREEGDQWHPWPHPPVMPKPPASTSRADCREFLELVLGPAPIPGEEPTSDESAALSAYTARRAELASYLRDIGYGAIP